MTRRVFIACFILAVFTYSSSARAAIVLGLLDDFQLGDAEGWIHAQTNANSPVAEADQGPAGMGDTALRISSAGTGRQGSRYLAFKSPVAADLPDWTGSYTGAGVTGIQFQVNNTGAADLNLRLALDGAGGWFVTAPIVVSSGSNWLMPQTFDVTASALFAVGGATDVNATLANVTGVQIMSAASLPDVGNGRPRGDNFAGSALFDNFTAVPEPSTFGMLACLISLAPLRSRRRR